jgi:hypothetical protein
MKTSLNLSASVIKSLLYQRFQVVDGLKLVCHELAKAAGDPDSGALDELANDADLLVTTLFVKVRDLFFRR